MLGRSEIVRRVIRQIAIELKVEEAEVLRARSLRDDLKMDSVGAANVLFALEEELGVEIDLDDVVSLDTVADIQVVVLVALGEE